MAYEQTGLISFADYNTLITNINVTYGTGTGTSGYGGLATGPGSVEPGINSITELPSKILGDVITLRDWLDLRNAYEDCARHQGTLLSVRQKGTVLAATYFPGDTIIVNADTVTFTTGGITLTGGTVPPDPEYITNDGIVVNTVPVNFATGTVSETGSIGGLPITYTTNNDMFINGVQMNFTLGTITETGSTINPTTFGETLTINGTDVVLHLPTVNVASAFNDFVGTVGEGEAAVGFSISAVDDAEAPITPGYTLLGTLPTGLSLGAVSGDITGTVTVASITTDTVYSFNTEADDGGTSTVQQVFIIHVNCATFVNGSGTSATGRTKVDTSTFVTDINLIYALGTGATGYGQTAVTSPTVDVCMSEVTLDAWKDIISDLEQHQGITLSPTLPLDSIIQDPKPWTAEVYFDTLVTNLNQLELDPTLVDSVASTAITVDPNSISQSRGSAWVSTVSHEFTVTFTDQDHARAFFNAGGQIRLAGSRSGGSATNQNTNWTTLLSTAGTVLYDGDDYFALTTSFVSVANFVGTGVYSANDWDIAAKTNTVTDGTGRGGKGNILTFRSQYNDDHVGTGGGPDSVDGTLTSDISMRNVDGTFLTITAPTFATTVTL